MKNPSRTMLYSAAGIFMAFLIVICVNIIAGSFHWRFDLTSDKIFTLSDGTKKIISGIEVPVHIRFYFSKSNPQTPGNIKSFASRVDDLLEEYRIASRGTIKVERLDPAPYSDAEDSAALEGISSQLLNSGERIYCGISVSSLDKLRTIPFLSPQKENLLEYDITRAISDVTRDYKKVIGVISALPVLGMPKMQPPPGAMLAGKFSPPGPWIPFKELEGSYDIRKIGLDAESIDNDVNLLILMQPSGITEKCQLAVDQFLLRGGKMIVMLDPCSFYSLVKAASDPSYRETLSCALPTLLNAWGVKFNKNIVVADMTFATRIDSPQTKITYPSILDISEKGINRENAVTAMLEKLAFAFAGFFEFAENPSIRKEILVNSSKDSMPISAFLANRPEMIVKNFSPGGKKFDIAIMLRGDFKTAFPEAKPQQGGKPLLKKSASSSSTVVLISDTDFLFNDVCAQFSYDQFGRKFYIRKNDNISFFHNLVETLSGDNTMIDIRCRQTMTRPFIRINELKSKSEQEYKNKILVLEKVLLEIQNKINALEKESSGRYSKYIFSPEQQAELRKFQEKSVEARKELKKLRKSLYSSISRIENTIKWLNISLIPVIVIVIGLSWALMIRRRGNSR